MRKISIIGSGTVGTTVGKGFSKLGNYVIFYDVNKNRLNKLKSEGFDVALNLNYTIENSDISFITVPTPSNQNGIDLRFVDNVTRNCSKVLKNKKDYHIFALKSTIIPGTTEGLAIPNLEKYSHKKIDEDFGVVYNPEFLTEIAGSWTNEKEFQKDFFTEDRVVIGEGKDKRAGNEIENLFKDLRVPIIRTDYKTAEMIKYASNAALASRISYWNEIFLICENLEIDSHFVATVVGMDKRIGKYGTVHSLAYGGKCLDKDLKAFINFVKEETGIDPQLFKAVDQINEHMKKKYGVRE